MEHPQWQKAGDPLRYFDLSDLESAVRQHLPPAVHEIALEWARRCAQQAVSELEEAVMLEMDKRLREAGMKE
jgi:hypothetical protein